MTLEEYQDTKLPFVKREYGVVNPQSGNVIPVESPDYAKYMAGYMESMVVYRAASEWLEYKPVGDG